MTSLVQQLTEDNQALDKSHDEAIAIAWRAVWKALARDACGVASDQDAIDLQSAMDDLENFGVVEDQTATLNRCSDEMRKMVNHTTQTMLAWRTEQYRKDAIAEYQRFKRFAPKMEERLKRRSRSFAVNRIHQPGHLWHIDPIYADLFDERKDGLLKLDEDSLSEIEAKVESQVEAMDDRAESLSLPPEFMEFVDQFNIDNPTYADRRDDAYASKIPGEMENRERARVTAEISKLTQTIKSIQDPEFNLREFGEPIRSALEMGINHASKVIGIASPIDRLPHPTKEDLEYGRPESRWSESPFVNEGRHAEFIRRRNSKVTELNKELAKLNQELSALQSSINS